MRKLFMLSLKSLKNDTEERWLKVNMSACQQLLHMKGFFLICFSLFQIGNATGKNISYKLYD